MAKLFVAISVVFYTAISRTVITTSHSVGCCCCKVVIRRSGRGITNYCSSSADTGYTRSIADEMNDAANRLLLTCTT